MKALISCLKNPTFYISFSLNRNYYKSKEIWNYRLFKNDMFSSVNSLKDDISLQIKILDNPLNLNFSKIFKTNKNK